MRPKSHLSSKYFFYTFMDIAGGILAKKVVVLSRLLRNPNSFNMEQYEQESTFESTETRRVSLVTSIPASKRQFLFTFTVDTACC